MMRLIRQLFGKSRREAQADAMAEQLRRDFETGERQVRRSRLALERLVAELQKDTTSWR